METKHDLPQEQPLSVLPVSGSDVYVGMMVQDNEGKKGTVRCCEDLHNVHVTFEGSGIVLDWYGYNLECGGSAFYCLYEGCDDNLTQPNDLYHYR